MTKNTKELTPKQWELLKDLKVGRVISKSTMVKTEYSMIRSFLFPKQSQRSNHHNHDLPSLGNDLLVFSHKEIGVSDKLIQNMLKMGLIECPQTPTHDQLMPRSTEVLRIKLTDKGKELSKGNKKMNDEIIDVQTFDETHYITTKKHHQIEIHDESVSLENGASVRLEMCGSIPKYIIVGGVKYYNENFTR